jgi:hypothetical protein
LKLNSTTNVSAIASRMPPPKLNRQQSKRVQVVTNPFEWWEWTTRGLALCILGISATSAVVELMRLLQHHQERLDCDFDCRVDRVLAHSVTPTNPQYEAPFVPRPEIEALLRSAMGVCPRDKFTIVAGTLGSGKSRIVRQVAMNRTGVVHLSYFTGDFVRRNRRISVAEQILTDMTMSQAPVVNSQQEVLDICGAAATRHRLAHPSNPLWIPTLIIEMRSDFNISSGINAVAGIAKQLGVDGQRRLSVIVVLDEGAIVHLPFDNDRHNVIWVDDFSESEAHLFLDYLGAFPLNVRIDANGSDLNASLRQRVFEFVGTRAATLVDLVHLLGNVQAEAIDCRVDAWIDEQIDDARTTLGRLFALADHRGDFDLRVVVDALLKSRQQAVRTSELPGLLVSPRLVSEILQERHALVYHFPTSTYRFASRAVFHAAKQLLE